MLPIPGGEKIRWSPRGIFAFLFDAASKRETFRSIGGKEGFCKEKSTIVPFRISGRGRTVLTYPLERERAGKDPLWIKEGERGEEHREKKKKGERMIIYLERGKREISIIIIPGSRNRVRGKGDAQKN